MNADELGEIFQLITNLYIIIVEQIHVFPILKHLSDVNLLLILHQVFVKLMTYVTIELFRSRRHAHKNSDFQ